jgi:hypothetical protein
MEPRQDERANERTRPGESGGDARTAEEARRQPADEERSRPGSLNCHRDVAPWVDTCSCEPEPRWRALEDE